MKLIFSLAVISNKNQKIEDLLKAYIRDSYNDDLEKAIKEKKHFISGIKYGDFDDELTDSRTLLLKDKNDCEVYKAKIKEVDWQKMIEKENEELKDKGIDIKTKSVDLEERFGFTNAIITPDGSWHGMIPINLIMMGFTKEEPVKEYIKNYYTKYVKPYEEEGNITMLSCNI